MANNTLLIKYSHYIIVAIILIAVVGFAVFGIMSTEYKKLSPEEQAKENERIESIRKDVPPLKQNGAYINEFATKTRIEFSMDEKNHSYELKFYENNKYVYMLYSLTFNKDERFYYFTKSEKKGNKKQFKVNNYDSFFVINDLMTNERWKIKYNKEKILIEKGNPNQEKLAYSLELAYKNRVYYYTYDTYDSERKLLGDTYYQQNKNKDEKGFLVICQNMDKSSKSITNFLTIDSTQNKKPGIIQLHHDYSMCNSKPRSDGNELLAAPGILTIDDLEKNLRLIMLLELSQME